MIYLMSLKSFQIADMNHIRTLLINQLMMRTIQNTETPLSLLPSSHFLLVSQNIVALTRVFETVPTLNQSIIDNVGLISSLTYGAFMAFGIVLTEFITGWTLFQRQEAQIEDGSKNFLHGPILVGISLIGAVFLMGDHCMVSIVRCSNK